jgi:hypothetical protein
VEDRVLIGLAIMLFVVELSYILALMNDDTILSDVGETNYAPLQCN